MSTKEHRFLRYAVNCQQELSERNIHTMFDVDCHGTTSTCTWLSSEIHTCVLQSPFWMVPSDRREPRIKASPSEDFQGHSSPPTNHIFFRNFLILRPCLPRGNHTKFDNLWRYSSCLWWKWNSAWLLLSPGWQSVFQERAVTWLPLWSQILWVYFCVISAPSRARRRGDLCNYAHTYVAGATPFFKESLPVTFQRKDFSNLLRRRV